MSKLKQFLLYVGISWELGKDSIKSTVKTCLYVCVGLACLISLIWICISDPGSKATLFAAILYAGVFALAFTVVGIAYIIRSLQEMYGEHKKFDKDIKCTNTKQEN